MRKATGLKCIHGVTLRFARLVDSSEWCDQCDGPQKFRCAEYEGCTKDSCAYPGDEFCEHDRLSARASGAAAE